MGTKILIGDKGIKHIRENTKLNREKDKKAKRQKRQKGRKDEKRKRDEKRRKDKKTKRA
jgi:hypothetical protein